ncbi:hypothetical protein ACOSP7_021548 [Xanthoceras sorbifolium]|uniref:Glycosyltransferase n=1 Tax=Xanthoceras sorbifolium TaxID=99658 RepID=A0ABQ8GWN9_9ROSI|nr:hypothetical protein JRO89_XSUnG0247100 [Xanthoceras sorbifolium]
MGSTGAIKPHAICIPYPAQGHIIPLLQFAKLLHSKGFHITFVNSEFNHRRLIRSKGPDCLKGLPDDFRLETIPDGLPPSDRDATQHLPSLSDSLQKTGLTPFLKLIEKLNSSGQVPPVSCVVADSVMSFGLKAAKILGIKDVTFWSASACGLLGYWQFDELVTRGLLPFKDENFLTDGSLDTPVDWIRGMPNMRLKDLPAFIRVTDLNDLLFNYMKSETESCLDSSAIVINTFDEFEHEALEVIESINPNIYTIGPLHLLCKQMPESDSFKMFTTNLWKEDPECLKWLDRREPNSVVYVNYGSITVMTDQHLKEFAWGLANSGHSFLWVVRPDVVMGTDSAILPEEYFEEIKDRGLIVSWCPQEQVLSHPSLGAFLTHCGWNSMLESMINAGKPLICWPFFAEQQTNTRYACTTWGIGMEVNHDVKRDEIEALVKEVMEGEKGKKMKEKALEWQKKAIAAANIGGTSYNNLERCIKEVFSYGY